MRCALLALALAGCAAAPAPRDDRVQVRIENDGPTSLCDVHMRPSSHVAAGWARDWLDRSEVIVPGMWRTFRVPRGERWDLRLVACDGAERAEYHRVLDGDVRVRWTGLPPP